MNKRPKIEIICPSCGKSRIVCYSQGWNIKVGDCSGKCSNCAYVGLKNSGQFKKGQKSWNKDKKLTGQHLEKILRHLKKLNLHQKGKNPFHDKHHTAEAKKIMAFKKLGKKSSYETRKKMSISHGGTGNLEETVLYDLTIFNKELKLKIRKRDNYTCQKCGMTEEEHIIVYGKVLSVHHIDYNKKNCEEDNLITLCGECNVRVNFNREYWKEYFKRQTKQEELICQ